MAPGFTEDLLWSQVRDISRVARLPRSEAKTGGMFLSRWIFEFGIGCSCASKIRKVKVFSTFHEPRKSFLLFLVLFTFNKKVIE